MKKLIIITLFSIMLASCTEPPTTKPTDTPSLTFSIDVIAPVAWGEGVPDAGEYDPNSSGLPRVVILAETERLQKWNDEIAKEMQPSYLSEVSLVVIIKEMKTKLDTAAYLGGPEITRYRQDLWVQVREARTGILLSMTILQGGEPKPFPEGAPVGQTSIYGDHVSIDEMIAWLVYDADLQQNTVLRNAILHEDCVNCVAFSHDGDMLAARVVWDNHVYLWRVSDGKLVHTLGHDSMVESMAFSPVDALLASGHYDGTIRLWWVDDGTLVNTWADHKGRVVNMAFSPDGEMLASRGTWDEHVYLWRVADGTLISTLDHKWPPIYSLAFSPDGALLAAGSSNGTIRLWRVADGTLVETIEGHDFNVICLSFSSDGELLVSGSADRTLRLWQVSNGELLRTLEHNDWVYSLVFSPDGALLVSGSEDRTIRLWRVADGTLLKTIEGHNGGVTSLDFSPNGAMLASGSHDRFVYLWDIEAILEGILP